MRNLKYVAIIFLLALLIKEYKIEKGNFVIWDEAHFGKFSQKYLSRAFYFDVHPPLGKLLTALSGYLFGQSESFLFSSPEKFPQSFDYVGMRRMHAFLGAIVPTIAFLTLRNLNFTIRRSFLCSLLFIFENGMTSITRLILLDTHLLLFTSAVAFFLTLLRRHRNQGHLPHPVIASLGFFIGCAASVKWIGCLTMLWVGLYIIYDLDNTLRTTNVFTFIHLFSIYFVYLIVLPLCLYISLFYLHFNIVNNSSEDDGFVSIPFQMTLKNSPYSKLKKYISFGQQITLLGENGYLHSHNHKYPESLVDPTSNILQVTGYGARDVNNNLYFQKVTDEKEVEHLESGDEIAILHSETGGYVGVLETRSLYSDGLLVGNKVGTAESESIWVVKGTEGRIKTYKDEFYLINKEYGCYLTLSESKYPSWGYEQGEVYCDKDAKKVSKWRVEENFFSNGDDNPVYSDLAAGFISRLNEHHVLMWNTNKSFTQDPDLEPDLIVSKPMDWILLRKGLRMSQWGDHHKFYMFFNPLISVLSLLGLLGAPGCWVIRWIAAQRKKSTSFKKTVKPVRSGKFILFLGIVGWAVHYVPFFFVTRVLYMHHYFPALYFSLFALSAVFRRIKFRYHFLITFSVILVYAFYSPLTYGFIDGGRVKWLALLRGWNFVD